MTIILRQVSTDLSLDAIPPVNLDLDSNSHVRSMGDCNPVFVELMRKVPPLTSEEPEAILRFVAFLDDVYMLKLCDDRSFVTVPGVILRFFGDYLKNDRDWEQCKRALLREFFPHFIRERLIRDLITFNFHKETTPVREYIDQVFSAARMLRYEAQEQDLVDRIIMNLHPAVLAQSAFVDRPHSRKELYDVVGIIEEKIAVDRERQRHRTALRGTGQEEPQGRGVDRSDSYPSRSIKCWRCGHLGHIERYCHRRTSQPGNRQVPGGSRTPGHE